MDFKDKEEETLGALIKALAPLHEKGYLSHVADGKLVESKITIVASGFAEFDDINALEDRHIFMDAVITDLEAHDYNELNAYYASVNWGSAKDVDAEIAAAHELGLKVRYYKIKENEWEDLSARGVDRLNADDLANTARLPRM